MRGALSLLVLIVAACAGPAPSPPTGPTSVGSPVPSQPPGAVNPTRICDVSQDDVKPVATCTEIIGRVLLALGPDRASVRAAWMRHGAPCPPNARCAPPPPGSAFVVLDVDGGATMAVRVAIGDGQVEVGQPEQLAWDEWPATGEVAPPPAAPVVGEAVPAEIAGRQALPFCGEDLPNTDDRQDRTCFWAAVRDARPAELIVRGGESALEVMRYVGRGPVLVYRQAVEGGTWIRDDCAIGGAFDDELTFVVSECLSTPVR
ncbi:MAG TPA: hypothetical protein VH723_08220 [Candidatus Limnocylindrales bacterium]